jgi:pSer/pThr/pTyr-binding forkhead associated (FHA) protein/S1-C subfamily serine protease
VKCELRIISGARAGHRDVFEKSYIGIGRHPMSDLRFDAEQDIDASTRHAAIVKTGDAWAIRDLGSTNGTFVNGERLTADRPLRDGDTLRFGVHGPEVAFRVLREGEEVVMPAVQPPPPRTAPEGDPARPQAPKPTREAGRRTEPSPPPPPGPSKTAVLRAEISRQHSRLQALGIILGMIVVGALAVVYWQGRERNQAVTTVQQRADSLELELAQLRALQAMTDSAKAALEVQLAAERDPARRQQLQVQLGTVTRRSAAIQQAQGVDYTAIRNQNDRAIAVIYVRFPDTTQMWTGTAFSVSPGGRMLTNRHLVRSRAGESPRDIAIQFSGSREVLPARVVRVSPDADLAVLQLESPGPFPAVAGLDDSGTQTAEGAPIALIGFPGGADGTSIPRSKLVTGSVTRVAGDSILELDAFSGTGASGSPIFGRDGRVVGVLFGGRGGASSSEIVGLPIRRALGLLGN